MKVLLLLRLLFSRVGEHESAYFAAYQAMHHLHRRPVDQDIALARAYGDSNDDVTALLMLLRVERTSPDDLRHNGTARAVIQALWHTVVPSVRTELTHLLERLGTPS